MGCKINTHKLDIDWGGFHIPETLKSSSWDHGRHSSRISELLFKHKYIKSDGGGKFSEAWESSVRHLTDSHWAAEVFSPSRGYDGCHSDTRTEPMKFRWLIAAILTGSRVIITLVIDQLAGFVSHNKVVKVWFVFCITVREVPPPPL